jgi:hypothetical protein
MAPSFLYRAKRVGSALVSVRAQPLRVAIATILPLSSAAVNGKVYETDKMLGSKGFDGSGDG